MTDLKGIRILIVALLVCALVTSGCESLRKKFTRKKKEDAQSEEIPILEPMEYPAKAYSPQDDYKNHYSLCQIWLNDLASNIQDRASRKRDLYLLAEAVKHLGAMSGLIVQDKRVLLDNTAKELADIKATLESAVPNQDMATLKRRLESVEKTLRINYAFSKIKDSIQIIPVEAQPAK